MPIAEELLKPIPGPEEVGQGIVDLTNQTFERLSGRLALYVEDPRRSTGTEGTVILDENSGRLWEGGEYGSVAIRVANEPSLAQISKVLGEVHPFMQAYQSSWNSHFRLLDEARTGSINSPNRYKPIGQLLLFHALKDRYPRGDTDARESLMLPRDDYTKYPPEDWGERHKIGIEILSRFEDALAPTRQATWRFGMFLQHRFDKPIPQRETVSTFDGLVDSRDVRYRGEFKPRMTDKKTASHVDVEDMAALLAAAKDIRPIVTRIPRLLREQAAMQRMFDAFRDGRPIPT